MLSPAISVFEFGSSVDELNNSELINLDANFARPVETLDDWVEAGLENMPGLLQRAEVVRFFSPNTQLYPQLVRYGRIKRFYEENNNILVEFQETLPMTEDEVQNTFTLNLETTVSINIPSTAQ